jgi:DNA sulfur modification protein DndB
MRNRAARPSDEVLEEAYTVIVQRLDDLIANAGNVRSKFEAGVSPRDLRAPKGREQDGHPFMRPVIQKCVARVVAQIADQKVLDWSTILDRLSALPWKIGEAPWLAVFNPANNKIINSKENVELLDDLLYVHIAASSKQSIVKARKQFKDIRGSIYPLSEQQLQINLTPHTENRTVIPDVVSPGTLPSDSEAEVVEAAETPLE